MLKHVHRCNTQVFEHMLIKFKIFKPSQQCWAAFMRARRAASIGSLPCRAAPLRCSPMPTSSLSRAAHCSLPHAPLFFLPSLFFFLLYSELEQSHGWPPSLRPIRRLHDLPVQTLAPKPPPPPPPASPNPSRTPSRPNRRESKL